MKLYYAIVHKDEDSAFGVHFPDVPGCFSAADRQEDILANAVEALSLYFEDSEVLSASPIDTIRERAREDLEEGAFILAVPFIGRGAGKVVRVNLSLDQAVLVAIDRAANARKLTRSAFLADAARNEIEGRH